MIKYLFTSESVSEGHPDQLADQISNEILTAFVLKHFDLRPKGIVKILDLLRPIYQKTEIYGHFGRNEPEFTWETTDKTALLRASI